MEQISRIGAFFIVLAGVLGVITIIDYISHGPQHTADIIDGKYISGKESLSFDPDGTFYAVEYDKFNKGYTEFYGAYTIKGSELILKYEMLGIVQRFRISDNASVLYELGNQNLVYVREKP